MTLNTRKNTQQVTKNGASSMKPERKALRSWAKRKGFGVSDIE